MSKFISNNIWWIVGAIAVIAVILIYVRPFAKEPPTVPAAPTSTPATDPQAAKAASYCQNTFGSGYESKKASNGNWYCYEIGNTDAPGALIPTTSLT
jgi:hypothetical protein